MLTDLATRNPRVRFVRRAVPVPPDLRALWRVACVVVILQMAGRGASRRCSVRRLHALAWACRSPETSAALRDQLTAGTPHTGLFISVDPALNAAVALAVGEGLVVRNKGRLELTDTGKQMAAEVISGGLLAFEAATARELGPIANEGNLEALMRRSGTP